MATWIKPIYDRNQSDVDYAKSRMKYFRQNGGVTDGIDLKGCLNASDLNRIENNSRYLCDELSKYYYFSNIDTVHTWSIWSIPNTQQISRIITNVNTLISAYGTLSYAPALPTTLLSFEHINIVEINLYLIKDILDKMISSFRECNTFTCGEG